jgi:hypothetical protein
MSKHIHTRVTERDFYKHSGVFGGSRGGVGVQFEKWNMQSSEMSPSY